MTTPFAVKAAWFSSGAITYTQSALATVQQSRQTLPKLLLRHLTGDFGDISDDQAVINQQVMDSDAVIPLHDDIESRYLMANGQELVIVTHYVHTPLLRWTDICLASQLVSGRPAATAEEDERDELEFEPDEADLDAVAGGEAEPDEASTEPEPGDEFDDDLALDDLPAEITLERILRGIVDTNVILSSLRPGSWRDPTRLIGRADLESLTHSLRQDGLIHPPLIARDPNRTHYNIIAGEKRWRALCALAVAESGAVSLETALDIAAQPDGDQQLLTKWHYVLREVEIPARMDISQDPRRHLRQFSQDTTGQQDTAGQQAHRRRWKEADDEFLWKNIGRLSLAEIGGKLGRTPTAVMLRRRRLRIPPALTHRHRAGSGAQGWRNG